MSTLPEPIHPESNEHSHHAKRKDHRRPPTVMERSSGHPARRPEAHVERDLSEPEEPQVLQRFHSAEEHFHGGVQWGSCRVEKLESGACFDLDLLPSCHRRGRWS